MKKYRVTLEIDNKQFGMILAGLTGSLIDDERFVREYPHLEKDHAIYKHIHEVTELREYIRERYIEAEVVSDEDNSEG